jgi:hypothetical protein
MRLPGPLKDSFELSWPIFRLGDNISPTNLSPDYKSGLAVRKLYVKLNSYIELPEKERNPKNSNVYRNNRFVDVRPRWGRISYLQSFARNMKSLRDLHLIKK